VSFSCDENYFFRERGVAFVTGDGGDEELNAEAVRSARVARSSAPGDWVRSFGYVEPSDGPETISIAERINDCCSVVVSSSQVRMRRSARRSTGRASPGAEPPVVSAGGSVWGAAFALCSPVVSDSNPLPRATPTDVGLGSRT